MSPLRPPSASAPDAPSATDTRFFGHPRGLATLFFTEVWERFSYYGMRALLILFMTAAAAEGGLGFDKGRAGAIYGMYTASVYLLSLPGGWIADRFIGPRRAVLWGAIVIMLGHILLAAHTLPTFFVGLLVIVLGTGLLKPNISAMVGQLYAPADVRRDAGFSIFYMGINLGAFIAPLLTSWLADTKGIGLRPWLAERGLGPEIAWQLGFGAAAVGMAIGVVQYVLGARHLAPASHRPPDPAGAGQRRVLRFGLAGAAALVVGLTAAHLAGVLTLDVEAIANAYGVVLLAIVVGVFTWIFAAAKWTPAERRNLIVILALFLSSMVFWMAFEQAGSTLNLFAAESTRCEVFGWSFQPGQYQALNGLMIIALAPVFAWIWVRLGRHDPSSPAKFSLGLLFVGVGFFVMVPAARMAEAGALAGPWWLAVTYLTHTIGELCISPVGLSATTKLAPTRVAGLMMGVWFLSLSAGNYLGGTVARFYEDFTLPQIFGTVAAVCVGAALVLAAFIRPIRRMLAAKE